MSGFAPDIDLSNLDLEQLRALLAKIEQTLEVRRFEENLNRAVREYQGRDPNVIRL